MSKLDKIAILLGAVGAIVLVVEEPMTGGSWATASRQPALVSDQAASRLAQAQGGSDQ